MRFIIMYIRHLISTMRSWIIILIWILYPLNTLLGPDTLSKTSAPANETIVYSLYHNIFSFYTVTFITIPLFLLLLEHHSNFFDEPKVLIRHQSFARWWLKRLGFLCIDSLLYAVFTNMLVFYAIFINSRIGAITLSFIATLLKILIFQLVGYMVLGIVYTIGTYMTGKNFLGFVFAYGIVMVDFVLFQLQSYIQFLIPQMYFLLVPNIETDIDRSFAMIFVYLTSLLCLVGLVGYLLSSRMDVLGGVNHAYE